MPCSERGREVERLDDDRARTTSGTKKAKFAIMQESPVSYLSCSGGGLNGDTRWLDPAGAESVSLLFDLNSEVVNLVVMDDAYVVLVEDVVNTTSQVSCGDGFLKGRDDDQ